MAIDLIKRHLLSVARALGPLQTEVVYVGGAACALYADNPDAESPRITKDIDFFVEVETLGELEELREKLRQAGFIQSYEDNVTCRFRLADILVDVMNVKPLGWAPANPWYSKDPNVLWHIQIDKMAFSLLKSPYFLATKYAAYLSRGANDPRSSHDVEDIIYLLRNHSYFLNDWEAASPEVKDFLSLLFTNFIEKSEWRDALLGNLPYESQEADFMRLISMFGALAS